MTEVPTAHRRSGQRTEGLLLEGVDAFHQAAAVHVAAEVVKACQQRAAIREAIDADAVEHHVGLAFAGRPEGIVRGAEKAGVRRVVRTVLHARLEADKRRHGWIRAAQDF